MTDIAKCEGKDCNKADSCYRYLAPDDPYGYQAYIFDPPIDETGGCELYWQVEREPEIRNNLGYSSQEGKNNGKETS